ncbi:MarR family winged helix-turn-helix transcriptional regulator [Streptomyces sp. NPDC002659]|uniref:MarR family winged helix-turn-helix transcriptional regulator n=1 Tax=Streptomyces sp. NPDC002659 TaxID=3364656 RepID=UPI0036B5CE73
MLEEEPLAGSAEDFGVLLARAYIACVHELHAALKAVGYQDLGRWHGYVFRALDEDALNLRELADRLGMTSPGAIKIVDEMVSQGYVERFRDERDARVRRLRLSDRGRLALREARAFHRRFEATLAAAVGEADTATVRRVLTQVVDEREEVLAPVPLGPI